MAHDHTHVPYISHHKTTCLLGLGVQQAVEAGVGEAVGGPAEEEVRADPLPRQEDEGFGPFVGGWWLG